MYINIIVYDGGRNYLTLYLNKLPYNIRINN